MSNDIHDLKNNLGNIMVAYDMNNKPVYVRDLKLEGSLTVILKDAINPNIVQTLENSPVLIHGGPFANISIGCNSIIATKLGIKLADYVITEAGFGSDLGAEKFFDIKCRKAKIRPDCVVLVCTIKALKYNGGMEKDFFNQNIDAVYKGLPNLNVHIENMLKFNSNLVVCLNKYETDTLEEIDVVRKCCECYNVPFVISDSYSKGGVGSVMLANEVLKALEKKNEFNYTYSLDESIETKIGKICAGVYHAGKITYSKEALDKIEEIKRLNLEHLPVCISKTQYSITDDPKVLGYPTGHTIHIRDIEFYTGAGFIVVLTGKTLTMPGLPKEPNYEKIDIDDNLNVVGLS